MRKPNYDKFPAIPLPGKSSNVWKSYPAIFQALEKRLADKKGNGPSVLVLDTYPGVDDQELLGALQAHLKPNRIIQTLDLKKPEPDIRRMLERNLTDDRIFGVLSCHQLAEFFDQDRLDGARQLAAEWSQGLLVIYGVGAALVSRGDVLVVA